MSIKDELIEMLEELKKSLDVAGTSSKKLSNEEMEKLIDEARAKNKIGIKERLKDSIEFVSTDELENYILITNEKTCISASRFDTINLVMDLLQYLIKEKVLNKASIEKLVHCALMDKQEFDENSDKLFEDIMNSLIEDYDNLSK